MKCFSLLAFAAYGGWGLSHHDMWRDELQAWMLAAGANSIPELFANLRIEASHPMLWHLFIFCSKFLWPDPRIIQALNGFIVVLAAALLIRSKAWSRFEKGLILSGYYFIFEYFLISRSYGLSLLLCFLFASHIERNASRAQGIAAGIILGLLANTHVYGLLLSVGFAVFCIFNDRRVRPVFLAILMFFWCGAYATMRPSGAAPFQEGRTLLDAALQVRGFFGDQLVHSWLPFPDIRRTGFWNATLPPESWRVPRFLIGLLVPMIAWRTLPRQRAIHAAFFATTVGFYLFFSFRFHGYLRHHGTWWVGVVSLIWLGRAISKDRRSVQVKTFLLPSSVAGLMAVAFWSWRPFSPARITAEWIREHARTSSFVLVGDPAVQTSPISAFLDRPIFYREGGYRGTFVRWSQDKARRSWPEIMEMVPAKEETFIILAGRGRRESASALAGVAQEVAEFQAGLVDDEAYLVLRKRD